MAKDILEKLFEDLLSGTDAANSEARERARASILENPQTEYAALADIAAHLDSAPDSGGDAAFIAKLASDPDALHEVESAQTFVERLSREEEPVPATLLRLVGAAPAAKRVVRLEAMPTRRISLRRKPVLLWGGAIAAMVIAGVTGFAIRGAVDFGNEPLASAPTPNQEKDAVALLPPISGDAANSTLPNYSVVNPPIPISSHAVGPGDYPPESLQFQEQGTVKVKYLVLRDGTVSTCQVEISSGFARLDDAACVLTKQWLFKPATAKDGSAVDSWLDASIVYQLRSGGPPPPPRAPATASVASGATALRAAIAKPLNEAMKAIAAKEFATALARIQEADSVPGKTPFEEYQVAKYFGFIAMNQPKPDYAAAAKAYNREAASGGVPQSERANMYNVAMRLNYQMKDFPNVIRDATELQKFQMLDDTGALVLIQSYYNLNDFANAAVTAGVFVAAKRAAGKAPPKDVLALLEKSEAALKNASPSSAPIALTSHAVTADDYPPVSIRLQEQGFVAVEYLVKEDGRVGECAVTGSSGKARLDDAACTMVKRRWIFKPATRNGKPVAEYLTALIVFQLK